MIGGLLTPVENRGDIVQFMPVRTPDMLLPVLLLQQIALYYGANEIFLCIDKSVNQGDSFMSHLMEQICLSELPVSVLTSNQLEKHLLKSSSANQSSGKDRWLLAHCQNSSIPQEYLESNMMWISGEASYDLPFRFDTNFLTYQVNGTIYQLWENYKIKQTIKVRIILGQWSEEEGLQIEIDEKWERRSNLQGAELRNIILPWSTWNIIDDNDKVTGLFPEVLHILQGALNFSVVTNLSSDRQFGAMKEDGNWTGIIGDLSRDVGDFSSSGLTVLLTRQKMVDYSITLMEDNVALYQLSSRGFSSTGLSVKAYLNIFQDTVWVAAAIAIGAVLGVAAIGESQLKKDGRDPYSPFLLGIWFPTAGSTNPEDMQKRSTKVLFLAAALLTYMLTNCFCVDLIAHMTVGQSSTIRNCEDIQKNGFEIFVRSGGSVADFFLESGLLSSCRSTVSFVLPGCVETCVLQTLERQKGSFFYTSELRDPRLSIVNSFPSVQTPIAWNFPKNSDIAELFNHHLLQLLQSGTYARLYHKWIGQYRISHSQIETKSSVDPINLDHLYFPMSVVLIGVAGSAIVAIVERYPLFFFPSVMRRVF